MKTDLKSDFYDNYVPLIDDITDAIPIVISDNEEYLSNLLNQSQMTYVNSLDFFSSKNMTVFLSK